MIYTIRVHLLSTWEEKQRIQDMLLSMKLGEKYLNHILNHADVFHCEQIEEVADRFREACNIEIGDFDNVATCKYDVSSYWDIGAVYARLIESISNGEVIGKIIEVYHSWISGYIDNYNIAVYYMTPQYL